MPTVILFSIDGLHPEAVTTAICPNLASVLTRGASTLRATSVMPSVTLPCHMSIFHSVPPARHGVTTNEWRPMARPLPGLIETTRAAGLRSAFFFNWEPLRNLSQPGSLSFAYFRDNVETPDGDRDIAEVAARAMAADRPDFAFVYFGTVDTVGHAFGWLSDAYLAQVASVDRVLRLVLDALPEDSHVLIQSDHGGHERTHGTDSAADMTIPWVVAGPGVRRNHALAAPVSLLDTAPTLARLLNIKPHPQWEGRSVAEAFEPNGGGEF